MRDGEKTIMRLNQLARAGAAAVVVAAAGIALPTVIFAAAPMVKTQAPGFYRMMLGDFEVTALSDGTAALPIDKLLTNIKPATLKRGLDYAYLGLPTETSVNGFLINTGSKLVLIDTGAGALFGPTLGKLVNNLKAAGYQPEQVDEVYITHLHPDHVGGLMAGDQLAFPNAIVRADKREADFWLSEANRDKAPADSKSFFIGAMASLNPYIKAGKFKPFDGDTSLVDGVKAVAAHGHTAGHTVYVAESKGKKLIAWGDLIHVGAVQFPNPSVTIRFDTDSKAAMAQRKKIFANVADEGELVAASHLSFPGLGHIHSVDGGYVWLPANYSVP
jgi:glyoxylase-like metal-dependent hydrolase (beta-lactamase superfamily II)